MGLIDITKNHQIWLNLQVQRRMPKQGLSKKLQGLAKLKLESNIFRMEGQDQKQCWNLDRPIDRDKSEHQIFCVQE